MTTSCIIRHFEHYAKLSPEEQELLASLEKTPRDYARNTSVWQQGDRSEHFYTVRSGWACTYRSMEDGSRQVVDIYVPGDIVGLREFAFQQRDSSLVVATDATLCPFPKFRLSDVFAASPLLCNLFFFIAARDQAILVERLVNLGRRSAREKVAHFLLEMAFRLDKACAAIQNCNHVPLTQVLIADALGLSTVHVNRTLNELKHDGLVALGSDGIFVEDRKRLQEVAGFEDGYLQEDVNSLLKTLDAKPGRPQD